MSIPQPFHPTHGVSRFSTFACDGGNPCQRDSEILGLPSRFQNHQVYLNSVQQMVSGELAGKGLQTGFSRHGLPPQRAPLDTVYPLREHLNSVQRMVSGGYCEGLFPDMVCWTRLRNTWRKPVQTLQFHTRKWPTNFDDFSRLALRLRVTFFMSPNMSLFHFLSGWA